MKRPKSAKHAKTKPRKVRGRTRLLSKSHKAVSARKHSVAKNKKTVSVAKPVKKSRIVRIMGHGQFTINTRTLKKLDELDDSIVQFVSNERADDTEFKKRLTELTEIVVKDGKPLDPHEIIQSDIILPSADLSVDEAKKLFKGEGVIPEI